MEVAADAAQFLDEIVRAGDDFIGLADFREWCLERRRDKTATVGAEESGGIRAVAERLGGGGGDHGGGGLECTRVLPFGHPSVKAPLG